MEVPSEVLPKLVCENCDNYLSIGPVHLMDNVRYRCGRCLPSDGEQSTRIEAYEELAKLMSFPCRYQHNGCPSKVPFAENEAHEEACAYRKYICPIAESGKCKWKGIRTDLLEHCRRHHPDNVVRNPCTFTHNITRSSLQNYLLWTLGVLFLIQTKVCTVSRKIYHSVRLISDPARAANYKYTLRIRNKDSSFCKHRQVAPRGCLSLQNDSSIQTDINRLPAMLEDFTGTTFTVTVESAGKGTTTEASVAESSSTRTHNTTSVEVGEARVECAECEEIVLPVYRGGWLCGNHAPEQRYCEHEDMSRIQECFYSDHENKCKSYKSRFCRFRSRCELCFANITSESLDAHYTQMHADIIHRAGAVCTVGPLNSEHKFLIRGYDFGRVLCTYKLLDFALYLYTPLRNYQLCKYKCTVDISHPDTGHTVTYEPTVRYDTEYDWGVHMSRRNFHKYSQNNKVNIKISITKI